MLYAKNIYIKKEKDPEPFLHAIEARYDTWKDDGWKNGYGKPINNWKNTLRNTLPYLKPIYNDKTKRRKRSLSQGSWNKILENQKTFGKL